jgi:hypothetical protein
MSVLMTAGKKAVQKGSKQQQQQNKKKKSKPVVGKTANGMVPAAGFVFNNIFSHSS